MIKCIVCAKRTENQDIQKAFTCTSCTEFLSANGFEYTGESIESYTASFAGVLARPENSEFLAEILNRRQEQKQSVLDAISAVMTKAGA
jgi:N-acetylglutamate synthase-like GNAT family acetyltransferase